jgi:hypothetical protein
MFVGKRFDFSMDLAEWLNQEKVEKKDVVYISQPINSEIYCLLWQEKTEYESFCDNLSVRSLNALKNAKIKSIKELIEKMKSGEIIRQRNVGKKSFAEIVYRLEEKRLITQEEKDSFIYPSPTYEAKPKASEIDRKLKLKRKVLTQNSENLDDEYMNILFRGRDNKYHISLICKNKMQEYKIKYNLDDSGITKD